MELVTLPDAKRQLAELIERAARGEDVRIAAPAIGTVRLQIVVDGSVDTPPRRHHRKFGRLAGTLEVPDGLLAPMSEEELKDWHGETP